MSYSNIFTFSCNVIPTFRPDMLLNITNEGFCEYISKLSDSVSFSINSFEELKKALICRMDYFNKNLICHSYKLD